MTKKHILILGKGGLYTLNNINQGKYISLSKWSTGDYTHIVLNKHIESDGNAIAGFNLVGCYIPIEYLEKYPMITSIYYFFYIYIRLIYRHFYVKRYECIISRNPIFAGVLGVLLSKTLRVPLVVEFNGNYAREENWKDHKKSFFGRVKQVVAQKTIPYVSKKANKIKLLYPGQADVYSNEKDKFYVFHEFTPVSSIEKIKNSDYKVPETNYVLFLGNPWETKGVDILIEAFNKLSTENMNYDLLIVGWFPGGAKENLLSRVKSKNIFIQDAVDYPDALALIAGCEILVLPSRTEAMGRVLLEGMALKKPLIGSNVDGIPHYILDKKVGVIFESENSTQLSKNISELMKDSELRKTYGENGYLHVMQTLNEELYSDKYKALIRSACED